MVRDTKLRMSIDQRIIDKLDELQPKVIESTRHKKNAPSLRVFSYNVPDSSDQIKFNFDEDGWLVTRICGKELIWDRQDKDSWTITSQQDLVRISTYGKMCVDINREILPLLDDLEIQVDLLENPIYCPICNHCGETGCCGFIEFLEKHVRNKTNCIYETRILDDLEEWIREEDA